MHNPFAEKHTGDDCDADCIARSLAGNQNALEDLILRHQSWIFNIALTMTGDVHLAEDVTQEVLIKVITKLSTYQPQKAAFRTWLYRIVANHILNMKENKKELFFAKMLANNDDVELINNQPDPRKQPAGNSLRMKEETKAHCILCMLLCLSRRERMVFTLAGVFGVTDKTGAEICEMSRTNFRQSFLRSRRKLHDFFSRNCSLLDDRNPCTCAGQATHLLKSGIINPRQLLVEQQSRGTIHGVLGAAINHVEDSYQEFLSLFRNQPFLDGPDMVQWLRDLMKNRHLSSLLDWAEVKQ